MSNVRPDPFCFVNSKDLIYEAIKILEAIIIRRESQSGHAYHVLGYQGLKWAEVGIPVDSEHLEFLVFLKGKIQDAVRLHSGDKNLEVF